MKIERNDVLSALGFSGFADNDLIAQIDSAIAYLDEMQPKFVFGVYDLTVKEDKYFVGDSDFELTGRGLVKLLNGCEKVALYGATMGNTIDKAINIARFSSKNRALVLDAAADAYIKKFVELSIEKLKSELSPLFLTERFTASFGEFAVSVQPKLLAKLDAHHQIGLGSSGMLLTPRKSETGVIGVTSDEKLVLFGKCTLCKNIHCRLRFKGQKCV